MEESDQIILHECPKGEKDCPILDSIGQMQQALKILKEEAQTDALTHLFNSRYFHRALSREIERTSRTGQPTTLILLDLDHFKKVNDTYGHLAGDKVLQSVAEILQTSLRKLDIPCRYGGEEFAILLPSTPLLVAVQAAERVRQQIESARIRWDGIDILITASLGLGTYSVDSKVTAPAFLEQVDKCLYESKRRGRNRITHGKQDQSTSEISSDEKAALSNLFTTDEAENTDEQEHSS